MTVIPPVKRKPVMKSSMVWSGRPFKKGFFSSSLTFINVEYKVYYYRGMINYG